MLLSALLILGQAAEQPTLAMTSVECYPVKICGGELEADRVYLQNKLESAVLAAADGRLKLITPEVVLRILQSSGQSEAEARKTCMNATCAVDLGGALGADYILQGQVLQPGGGDFELTLKVWSISGSNVIKDGAIQAGDLLSFRSQLKKLATGVLAPIVKRSRRRQASEVLAFDDGEETGPQVDSGQVTAALGGLMVAGAPTSAKVEVSGPDNRTFVMKVGDSVEGLMPGKYRWQASADGYQPASGRVEIPPDGFANIPLKLNKLASLKLAGRPAKARVDITGPDGQSMQPVGLGSTLRGLIPGRYQLRISKRGYEAQETSLLVAPGAAAETNINLLTLGSLKIEGRPKGAQVIVENKGLGFRHQGGLPWQASGLKSGRYEVQIERVGYLAQRFQAQVKAGHTTRLPVDLRRDPEYVKRFGWLKIVGAPAGAAIKVTGETKADFKGGLEPITVPMAPGEYRVEVMLEGHEPWARSLDLPLEKETVVQVRLMSFERRRRHRLFLLGSGASLFSLGLGVGAHHHVSRPNPDDWSSSVALSADMMMVAGGALFAWGWTR